MGAPVARHQLVERVWPRIEKGLRDSPRRHQAERVAVAAHVLGGEHALLAADAHREDPPRPHQLVDQCDRIELRRHPRAHLRRREIAHVEQEVVQPVRVLRRVRQPLQLSLVLLHRLGVEQLRSSASPSSSRSCAWSTVSACARRSASGASPS